MSLSNVCVRAHTLTHTHTHIHIMHQINHVCFLPVAPHVGCFFVPLLIPLCGSYTWKVANLHHSLNVKKSHMDSPES